MSKRTRPKGLAAQISYLTNGTNKKPSKTAN